MQGLCQLAAGAAAGADHVTARRITGYVDVVSERAYRYRKGQPSELIQIPSEMADHEQEALNKLVEALADR